MSFRAISLSTKLRSLSQTSYRSSQRIHLSVIHYARCQSYPILSQIPQLRSSFSSKSEEDSSVPVEENLGIIDKYDRNHKIFHYSDGTVVIRCALGDIIRRGHNDSVITLSVGGEEFKTLTSTVASCPKLVDICMSAQKNENLLDMNGKAIFIDRDPEVFGYLISYLRNRLEGLSINSSTSYAEKKHIQLPKEPLKLKQLYLEATFFQLEFLKKDISKSTFIASIVSTFVSEESNPFELASKFFKVARHTFIVIGGFIVAHTAVNGGQLPWYVKPIAEVLPLVA